MHRTIFGCNLLVEVISGTIFVLLCALVLKMLQPCSRAWSQIGMDALRHDQGSGIPSRGEQEPSLSPRPRTTKITFFPVTGSFDNQNERILLSWDADRSVVISLHSTYGKQRLLLMEVFCLTRRGCLKNFKHHGAN